MLLSSYHLTERYLQAGAGAGAAGEFESAGDDKEGTGTGRRYGSNFDAIHASVSAVGAGAPPGGGDPEETRRLCVAYSRFLLATVSTEVDRLEGLVRKRHPQFVHIDLEVL